MYHQVVLVGGPTAIPCSPSSVTTIHPTHSVREWKHSGTHINKRPCLTQIPADGWMVGGGG